MLLLYFKLITVIATQLVFFV